MDAQSQVETGCVAHCSVVIYAGLNPFVDCTLQTIIQSLSREFWPIHKVQQFKEVSIKEPHAIVLELKFKSLHMIQIDVCAQQFSHQFT